MKIFSFFKQKNIKGFVLPLTLVVCVIILMIATGISIILAKELYFSKLSRLSQTAYYAADNALMCATMIDDQYIDPDTGAGIFQYNNLVTSQMVLDKINTARTAQGLSTITLNDIVCATSKIFDTSTTNYAIGAFSRQDGSGSEAGITTTFDMRIDLGGGEYRCASVMVNKTPTYRQIIARGFASCSSVFGYPIERAIVSTSESVGIKTSALTATVLTSGTQWTVPANVTSIKVWAIGPGGNGGSAFAGDNTAGGGGGAGGVAYKVFSVTPGQILTYAVGTVGGGPSGGITSFTVNGNTIYGYYGNSGSMSGGSGEYSIRATGGIAVNGDNNYTGGSGIEVSTGYNGSGGGGIGGAQGGMGSGMCNNGGQAVDMNGLFAVLNSLDYTTDNGFGAGSGSGCPTSNGPGGNALGFGSGGGGADHGNGGNGSFGGGGGGAKGWSGGPNPSTGGHGGDGAIVISWGQ